MPRSEDARVYLKTGGASRTESMSSPPSPPGARRIHARGKFLVAGEEKFHVRGVTYGAAALCGGGGQGDALLLRAF